MSENPFNLISLDDEGRAPEDRIKDANSARTILNELLSNDAVSSKKRAMTQGMIDGNPPFSETQLSKMGQKDRINVNWRHVEAKVEESIIPYYDMLTNVPTYATIECGYGQDAMMQSRWSQIITEKFQSLIEKYSGWLTQNQLKHRCIGVHGRACLYFRDHLDWRPRNLDTWNIQVERDASVDFEDWEFAFFLDDYHVTDIYDRIRNSESAKRNGWNEENCKAAIMNAHAVGKEDTRRGWEWYQQELRTNGLAFAQVTCEKVAIAHMLVKEFNGKISQYTFDRQGSTDWLCVRKNAYNKLSEVFVIFTDGVGNGKYHGIRGLGSKLYNYGQAMNRLNNSILEGGILASSVMLQPQSPEDIAQIKSLDIGPWKILPPGIQITPVNLTNNLGPILNVAGYFQQQEGGISNSYMPTIQIDRSRRQSNQEIESAERDRAILTNHRAEAYMRALDRIYEEMYRRAVNPNLVEEDPGGKLALEFQQACINSGVPKAALLNYKSVKATRSMGQGSASNRQVKMQQISEFIPLVPEKQRINIIRDRIAAIGGPQFVDKYAPPLDNEPSGADMSIASLENNAFLQGGEVLLDKNQNHFIHAQIHLQFFGSLITLLDRSEIDTRQVLQALQVGGPHTQLHLQYLQRDPTRKQQFEALNRQMSELMKITDNIVRMVQEQEAQEEANQGQSQLSPEMFEAQQRIQIERAKAENDIRIKQAKAEQQMRLKDLTTAQEIELKKQKSNEPTPTAAIPMAQNSGQSSTSSVPTEG